MAVDAPDHGRVEARAGGEREPAVVHAREVDRPGRPLVGEPEQMLRGVDDVGRDAEHAAVDVGRAARQAGQHGRGAGEPVGGLVDGAVAAEGHDDVVALVRRRLAELDRVPLALRVDGLDLEPALQRVDDQLLEPHGHRRGVRVDDHQHAPGGRRRLERGRVRESFERGGVGGWNHYGPEHHHTRAVTCVHVREATRGQRSSASPKVHDAGRGAILGTNPSGSGRRLTARTQRARPSSPR
jgi:hypothetical protein